MIPRANTYLGLPTFHTTNEATAWQARAAKENAWNTAQLSSVQRSARAEWVRDISARPAARAVRPLSGGTGTRRLAYVSHGHSQPALPCGRIVHAAGGGFVVPVSMRSKHRPASASAEGPAVRTSRASVLRQTAGQEAALMANLSAPLSQENRLSNHGRTMLGLHNRPTPLVPARVGTGTQSAAQREALVAQRRAREATHRAAEAKQQRQALRQAEARQAKETAEREQSERQRVRKVLEKALAGSRGRLGDSHLETIRARQDLDAFELEAKRAQRRLELARGHREQQEP